MRIAYAIFLMERLNSFEEASQQFRFANKCKPNLDEEFIIFRFSRTINEHIANIENEQGDSGFDYVK